MCSVTARLTINFVGNHTTGYLWSVLSQFLIPVGQILICDLPLNIKNLWERRVVQKGVQSSLPTVWNLPISHLTSHPWLLCERITILVLNSKLWQHPCGQWNKQNIYLSGASWPEYFIISSAQCTKEDQVVHVSLNKQIFRCFKPFYGNFWVINLK